MRVSLHIQPGASRTEISGQHGDAIKLRLAAPPVDGAANDALIAFLAELLSVSRNQVHICHGLKSRSKVVEIKGILIQDFKTRLRTP